MLRCETVSATGMPADTGGFSPFFTFTFAGVKKLVAHNRKVVNGETEISASVQPIIIGLKNYNRGTVIASSIVYLTCRLGLSAERCLAVSTGDLETRRKIPA